MESENTNKKTSCNKNIEKACAPAPAIVIPAKVVADVVGCSEPQVKKVRRGKIVRNTPMQVRIQRVEDELEIGVNALIEQVKAAVPFETTNQQTA